LDRLGKFRLDINAFKFDSFLQDFSRPLIEESPTNLPPVGWGSLIKPTAFTLAFSASVFGLASVWQYENMRANVIQQKMSDPVQNLWNSIVMDRRETNGTAGGNQITEKVCLSVCLF